MIRAVLDVKPERAGQRVGCSFCHCAFDIEAVAIRQVDARGVMVAYVCDECLALGEAHIRARLRKAAALSRQHAAQCEADAAGPIELPSIDLYRVMLNQPAQPVSGLKH
jgi:hypothetical protein